MEDTQIIMLYNRRDESAVAETSKKHGAACEIMAGRILSNTQDIEECVNDALMHAWNAIPPENPLNLGAYLVTITRNIALNMLKRNNRIKRGNGQATQVLDELYDCIHASEDIEESLDERLLTQTLDDFLAQLSYDARTVFVQRYIAMLSVSEIAEQYKFSESKVKSILMRTRKKLRKYLQQEGWL